MRRRIAVLLSLALAARVSAHCPPAGTLDVLAAPGRYAVGARTLTFVDGARPTAAHGGEAARPARTLVTEVWYPAAGTGGAAPLARGGPFPLVVSSHGLSDTRQGEAYLGRALASRGYVVAAPDFPLTHLGTPGGLVPGDVANQPGDVSFVVDALLEAARTRGGWLRGGVDRTRIGAMGLSLGGLTTALVTYHPALRDPRIRAAVPIAPAACWLGDAVYRTVRPPLLVLSGDDDILTPLATNARHVFDRARSPRRLVTLAHGTHMAFEGFFTAPSATSYDTLGCAVIGQIPPADMVGAITTLDPTNAGLLDLTGCALPCQVAPPSTPPMPAARQQEIATAAVVAFFEATFRHARAARCFLEHGLAETPDVRVESAPRRGLRAP
ncbi:MAG: hypothetical protein U0807_09270 [Candidatus Binatia bacterium]